MEELSLAVVVQRLVPAEVSGILFTANPVNGRRNEAVINAAWGLGEAVVGGEVTPDSYIIDKETYEILHREIAEKSVMTTCAEVGTKVVPVPRNLRRLPVFGDAKAIELTKLGVTIERLYGSPRDIEWVLSDGVFAIVQARPITALPEPMKDLDVPPPTEWSVPNPRAKYVRNNIVELMADPLTPLFSTLGRRIINRSMHRTLGEALGRSDILTGEIIVTVHGYAYYKGEFTVGQILRLFGNSLGIMRRMFTGMEKRWLDATQRYRERVQIWEARDWRVLPTKDLIEAVSDVFGMAIEYYMALVSGVIPAAWMTEALFTYVYRWLIKRRNDPDAVIYLLGFDSKPIQAEKALYDLAQWVRSHTELANYLLRLPADRFSVEREIRLAEVGNELWNTWRTRFESYLSSYGGTIYDLDFSQPTPADDPTPLAQTFKLFLRGEGQSPYERQEDAIERREQAMEAMLDRLRGLRRRLFRSTLVMAQTNAPRREDGLADIGLGYPLVRAMLLEVGQRLKHVGAIEDTEDVFWLFETEIDRSTELVVNGERLTSMHTLVQERKALWLARKHVTPPMSLPLLPKWLRKMLPDQFQVESDQLERMQSGVLKGVPCSVGRVTAPARILRGPEDFAQMVPGEVLVAAITTPAWTPLFAMAAGIVTDVGGPLSHGSIVAREYGIPAVLGTGVATLRIRNGQLVTVDGLTGTVTLGKV
jgi:pyruvate,water dikinase